MIDSQWFSFSLTPLMTVFAILLVVAGAIVSGMALQRTGFKRSQCFLEAIRFLLICSVAMVACQPESVAAAIFAKIGTDAAGSLGSVKQYDD